MVVNHILETFPKLIVFYWRTIHSSLIRKCHAFFCSVYFSDFSLHTFHTNFIHNNQYFTLPSFSIYLKARYELMQNCLSIIIILVIFSGFLSYFVFYYSSFKSSFIHMTITESCYERLRER